MNDTMNNGFKTNQEEHFWGCVLNKDKPEVKWSMEEEDDEEDYDFVAHTLFLKQAVLGAAAAKGERNLVQVETKNFDGEVVKHPILSLNLDHTEMCMLDLSFGHKTSVVFRLIQGTGPLHLIATHVVDYPADPDDSFCTASETDGEESVLKKSKKRKATTPAMKSRSKRGKLDSEAVTDESMEATNGEMDDEDEEEEEEESEEESEEDAEDEEDEEDEDEEEEEEESPKKSKKANGKPKKKEVSKAKKTSAVKTKASKVENGKKQKTAKKLKK